MVPEFFIMLPFILNEAMCHEDTTYLIEHSNVRGIKVGEEAHWTLDLNGSYIIGSVRIIKTFVDHQPFWMKVNGTKVSQVCNQSFIEENGWIVIVCNESLVIGRQLTIITSHKNSDLINNLQIDICSETTYPMIESGSQMETSSEENVYYESVNCILTKTWSNYTLWILVRMKEEMFVESFTFSGNNSELFKHKDFRNIMKAQVTNQETVNFNENETFCNSSSSSLFSCNKIGTSILIKSSASLSTGYLFCEAHIFGFKAHEGQDKEHRKCNFKILEKNISESGEFNGKKIEPWVVSLATLSSILLLSIVTWGILRIFRKLRIWSRRESWHLMQLLQRNDLKIHTNKNLLNPELELEFSKLPNGFIRSSNIGRKPLNLDKNRFQNIVPFDDNLVRLEGDESQYINASFIRGFDGSPKTYIATQGPKTNTLHEFWKLVWQYKVDVIVMLMQMVEANEADQDGDGFEIKVDDVAEENKEVSKMEISMYAELSIFLQPTTKST